MCYTLICGCFETSLDNLLIYSLLSFGINAIVNDHFSIKYVGNISCLKKSRITLVEIVFAQSVNLKRSKKLSKILIYHFLFLLHNNHTNWKLRLVNWIQFFQKFANNSFISIFQHSLWSFSKRVTVLN